MTKKSPLCRVGKFLLDFFEIYVPVATFSTMFLVFVLAIFFRYVLNHPLTWPYELTIFMFIWTIMFGAGLAKREGSHVVFSVVYDRLNPRKQLVSRIVAESIVLTAFSIAFWPSTTYILFWKTLRSPSLRVTFDIVFAPYIIFMVLMIGRSAYNLFKDVRLIIRNEVPR